MKHPTECGPMHSLSSMPAMVVHAFNRNLVESCDIKASQGYTTRVSKNKLFFARGSLMKPNRGQDSGGAATTSNSTLSDTSLASSSRALS